MFILPEKGNKIRKLLSSASRKTALKHMTPCTWNYYEYNKKFTTVFDSRTFTRFAELFPTHYVQRKQRVLYGKFYLTKLNSINTAFSGITLLLDNTLHSKKCINYLSHTITAAYALNQLRIKYCLYLCLMVLLHNTTTHKPQKMEQNLLSVTGWKNMFQYFAFFISISYAPVWQGI
jgi:hypothetical protein